MKECTTHHHACDCREREIKQLLEEITRSHADINDPAYNQCDEHPCNWCERVWNLYPPQPTKKGHKNENTKNTQS